MKILVIGAFAGETDLLQIPGVAVLNAGIGNVEAAVNLLNWLHVNPEIEHIIFTGSCGAYPHSELKTGDIFYSSSFLSIETSSIAGFSKIPEAMVHKITTGSFSPLTEYLQKKGFAEKVVNSISSITLSDLENEMMRKSLLCNAVAENMECFGLATAAKSTNKTFTAILGVSNSTGANGSSDWKLYWREISDSLQHLLQDFFRSYQEKKVL